MKKSHKPHEEEAERERRWNNNPGSGRARASSKCQALWPGSRNGSLGFAREHGCRSRRRFRGAATLRVDGNLRAIADAFNDIVSANQTMAHDLERVSRVVGKEGKVNQRANFRVSSGAWRAMEDSVNTLITDLVWPTTEVTRTIGAVAKGDLSQTMSLEMEGRPLQGEFLRSAKLVNTMIGQLSVFTSEVTRVAREVGTEGKLGGQAQVKDVSGVWKDLTESVNMMAGNLTAQVRNIADVTIAVANGDLSKDHGRCPR